MTDPAYLQAGAAQPEPHVAPETEGLRRRLSQRQLTMMAIGGAIGV